MHLDSPEIYRAATAKYHLVPGRGRQVLSVEEIVHNVLAEVRWSF